MVPLLIKLIGVLTPHVLEYIIAVTLSTLASYTFSDHFSALVIQHAFVSHFLMASSRVLIHLVALGDFVATTKGSLCPRLVRLSHRVAVSVSFSLNASLHALEFALTHGPHVTHCLHRISHCSLHVVSHFVHHLVNLAKGFREERIVSKWISCKALHHLTGHVVVVCHHAFKGRTVSISNLVLKGVRPQLLLLINSFWVGHCKGSRH